jgi:hypothetical protein
VMPKPIPLEAPVTMATYFSVIVVFIRDSSHLVLMVLPLKKLLSSFTRKSGCSSGIK